MPAIVPDESQQRDVGAVLEYLETTSPPLHDYVRQHLGRLIEDTLWVEAASKPADIIVDIGSFPWFSPAYLSLRGFRNISAVDIPRKDTFPRPPEWAFGVVPLDIEEATQPMADGSVDMVLLFEVFEHIYRRPNFVFRELYRILKPGGKVVITTPNGARLQSLIDLVLRRRFGPSLFDASAVYEDLGHFSHLREYSLQELREYLARCGFKVEQHAYRTHGPEGRKLTVLERVLSTFFPSLRRNLFLVCSRQT
jgi:SAM-dependent methyltransferase